jgi:hypothetical protein
VDESFSILSLPALELDPNFETHVLAFLHWNYLINEYRTQCSLLHARMDQACHAGFIYDKPTMASLLWLLVSSRPRWRGAARLQVRVSFRQVPAPPPRARVRSGLLRILA